MISVEHALYVLLTATFIAWFFAAWRIVAHRCPSRAIIPVYEPTAALSPAVARWLMRREYDTGALTASLFGLASGGHINIKRSGEKSFALSIPRRTTPLPSALEERELLQKLRRILPGTDAELPISSATRESVVDLRSRHLEVLRDIVEGDLHFPGRWDGRIFHLLILLPLILMLISLFVAGFGLYAIGGMALFLLARHSIGPKTAPKLRPLPLALMLLVVAWLGHISVEHLGKHGIAWNSVLAFHALAWPVFAIIAITLAGFILSVYTDLSELRPKPEACDLRQQSAGLQLFMSRADLDEIRQHRPGDSLPQSFQRLLPYAAAFGMMPLWLSLFAHELAQMSSMTDGGTGMSDTTAGDSAQATEMDMSSVDLWQQLEDDFDQALSDALDSAESSDSGGDGGGDGGGGGGD
ncbi:MAG: hypothetical protein AB1717_05400 [Pseudomonadota bacterium]